MAEPVISPPVDQSVWAPTGYELARNQMRLWLARGLPPRVVAWKWLGWGGAEGEVGIGPAMMVVWEGLTAALGGD
jgi:hypothetical protein